jgi:hypothetical protein
VRHALFALLFANLVYFGWAHWVGAPRPVGENAAFAKLPKLKMRSEMVEPAPGAAPASAHKVALNMAAVAGAHCVSIGPFGDIGSSARAAAVLKDKGFDPQQRAVAGETTQGFWVYVGGLTTDAQVETVRQDLIFHGIADAHAIADAGAVDRRVSVGLFSERERADKRAKQVQHLGLKAEVAEHKLPVSMYWVDVTSPSENTSVPIDDLLAEGVGSKVGVQACPSPTAPPVPAVAQSSAATASATTPKLP